MYAVIEMARGGIQVRDGSRAARFLADQVVVGAVAEVDVDSAAVDTPDREAHSVGDSGDLERCIGAERLDLPEIEAQRVGGCLGERNCSTIDAPSVSPLMRSSCTPTLNPSRFSIAFSATAWSGGICSAEIQPPGVVWTTTPTTRNPASSLLVSSRLRSALAGRVTAVVLDDAERLVVADAS